MQHVGYAVAKMYFAERTTTIAYTGNGRDVDRRAICLPGTELLLDAPRRAILAFSIAIRHAVVGSKQRVRVPELAPIGSCPRRLAALRRPAR